MYVSIVSDFSLNDIHYDLLIHIHNAWIYIEYFHIVPGSGWLQLSTQYLDNVYPVGI